MDISSVIVLTRNLLDFTDTRWSFCFEASKFFEILCLLSEVCLKYGEDDIWQKAFNDMVFKSHRFSKCVFVQGRSQFLRQLDAINICMAKLFQKCTNYDNSKDIGEFKSKLSHKILELMEKASSRYFIKGLIHLNIFTNSEIVDFLIVFGYNNLSFIQLIIDLFEDFIHNCESVDGIIFDDIVVNFIKITLIRDDRFIEKINSCIRISRETLWKLVFEKISISFRLRLLYILKKLDEYNDSFREYILIYENWQKVVEWLKMRIDDEANRFSDEPWLNIYDLHLWAQNFCSNINDLSE